MARPNRPAERVPTLDEASDAGRAKATEAVDAVDRHLPAPFGGIVRRLVDREILLQASSLAFYGLVSALPLLIIAFAVAGAVTGDGTLQRFVDSIARSQAGPQGLGRVIDQLVSSSRSLSWVMLVFTLWPATAYGSGLRRAFRHAADEDTGFAGLQGRLMGLGLVFALPLVVLGGIPLVFFLTSLGGDGALARVMGWLLAVGGASIVGALTTTLLYQAFAPGDLGWRDTARGAAVTALTTSVFSLLFVIYLNVGKVEQRFGGGTIGLIIMLGVWLFVANVLLLAGYHAVLELDGEGA